MSTLRLRVPKLECLSETLRETFGFDSRPEQLEAITTLAIDMKDMILIARTGFGKSMIFQSLPALRGSICLIIYPLNLLEEE